MGDVRKFISHPTDGSLLIYHGDNHDPQRQVLWANPPSGPVLSADGSVDDSKWINEIAPQPIDGERSLMGLELKISGPVKAFELNFAPRLLHDSGPVFSKDGSRLYVLNLNGVLTMYSVPAFDALKILDVKKDFKCGGFALTSEGILIGSKTDKCVYLLNEKTLKVTKRFFTDCNTVIAGTPESEFAVGFDLSEPAMCIFDLKSGKIVLRETSSEYKRRMAISESSGDLPEFAFSRIAKMTPNGNYIITANNKLTRYRVVTTGLEFEEEVEFASHHTQSLTLTNDFAMPGGGDHKSKGEAFPILKKGNYLFATKNFELPAVAIESGYKSRVVAMHPTSGLIFSHRSGFPLLMFSKDGKEIEACKFGKKKQSTSIKQLAISPDGKGIIVRGDKVSYWLEIQ